MKDLGPPLAEFEKIDIKLGSLSFSEIDQMRDLAGSYEAVFSKRAIKYKASPKALRTTPMFLNPEEFVYM